MQRLATIADSANGLSAELPIGEWIFIPPTISLTLARPPLGEWVHLNARTVISSAGTGLTHGAISDSEGMVGTVEQPLLIAESRPPR